MKVAVTMKNIAIMVSHEYFDAPENDLYGDIIKAQYDDLHDALAEYEINLQPLFIGKMIIMIGQNLI